LPGWFNQARQVVSRRRLSEVNVRCAYAALNEMVEALWPLP
jgi:hypothetical protein